MNIPLSVLDLSPIPSGATSQQALQNTFELAQLADQLGYSRVWYSEHHNSIGLASAAPEILIGHVAAKTTRIHVGSGGIMLPNHTPLKVVENFRLLEALHPSRIDLGIGRAPGTDRVTAFALRRSQEALNADDFPEQVAELLAFAANSFPDKHAFRQITAIPADVNLPPVWLLGSSDFSAQVAAAYGLGFAFAHHINPNLAIPVLRYYREHFVPSPLREHPHAILTVSAICAETDSEAQALSSSLDLMLLRLQTGQVGPFPSPEEANRYPYTPMERRIIESSQSRRIVGDPASVYSRLSALADQCQADEIMITTLVHSQAARLRSYALLADAFALPKMPVSVEPVPASKALAPV
jgi:luciferase family oxidoreductase group 1